MTVMPLEENLFHLINDLSGQIGLIDKLMIALSDSITWFILGGMMALASFRGRNLRLLSVLIAALIALGCSDLISFEVIKPIVGRERPCWLIPAKLIDGRCGGSYGFTSNHSANAFAVWSVVAFSYGIKSWQSYVTITTATLVALSRVYLGVHFVGDIAGGALLGIVVASSLWALGLPKISLEISKKLMPVSR